MEASSAPDRRPTAAGRAERLECEVHEGTRGRSSPEPLTPYFDAQARGETCAGYRVSRQPQALKRRVRAPRIDHQRGANQRRPQPITTFVVDREHLVYETHARD